jgi:hypothetical protein
VEAQQAACFLQYCCISNVSEYVSGSPGTTELRKTSNSTANAFVTVYSDEMESEVLRSFFPSVRGDVTFVWESVRNHVIVIV